MGFPTHYTPMTTDHAAVPDSASKAASEYLAGQMVPLETVFQMAPVGLAVVDRDYRFVHVNASLAAMNGIPAADHIGRSLRELIPRF